MEALKKIIENFKGKKILVIGDIMLDEHIWSKVSRISPESPVPVAQVASITHVPGGAANVAANISALGGIPYLIGIIGADSSGAKLLLALKRFNISTKNIIRDPSRPTILKSRIIAHNQHVVRVDREDKSPISQKITKRIVAAIKKLITEVDVVIISDYGKGTIGETVLKEAIKISRLKKKPIAVDPKSIDYSKYKRATIITPNLAEAQAASKIQITNEKDLEKAGRKLLKNLKTDHIMITRGKDGMAVFSKNQKTAYIPAIKREVYDITGAGDTVISTLSLALSAKASLLEAAHLANYAASVAVGKVGTAPVTQEELIVNIEGELHLKKKVRSRSELKEIVKNFRKEGLSLVFTNGCFDIIHAGHIRYLKEAKSHGDILIVGLNSNSSVRAIKGKERPYVNEKDRAEVLSAFDSVDYITIFNEKTPINLIKSLKPDIHVKGGDYKLKDLYEAKTVKSYGGKVVIIPEIKGKSTTGLIDKIKSKH